MFIGVLVCSCDLLQRSFPANDCMMFQEHHTESTAKQTAASTNMDTHESEYCSVTSSLPRMHSTSITRAPSLLSCTTSCSSHHAAAAAAVDTPCQPSNATPQATSRSREGRRHSTPTRSQQHTRVLCQVLSRCSCLCLLWLDDGGTTQTTGTAGSNKTDLLAWWGIAGHSGGVTNVLVVTTTVRMLHRVHGHTTHL